jgi:hypothetical protein
MGDAYCIHGRQRNCIYNLKLTLIGRDVLPDLSVE